MRKVKVERILENDGTQILFGGTIIGGPEDGQATSFHVPNHTDGDEIAEALSEGESEVQVEVP